MAGPLTRGAFLGQWRLMAIDGTVWTVPDSDANAAAFGRLPRGAAGRPGIFPAQSAQRSACFAPRRASAYVMRMVAPRVSSTSLEQLSQTRTVLRAAHCLLEFAEGHAHRGRRTDGI